MKLPTQKRVDSYTKKIIDSKVTDIRHIPKFCDMCGAYSSKKHQMIWCAHCPGKMKEYPEMTWRDCLDKSKTHGSGWHNSLWENIYYYFGGTYEGYNDKLSKAVSGSISKYYD